MLFVLIPTLAFAVDRSDDGIGPDGPNETYWYEIGPLDSRADVTYWLNTLYNNYWSFSVDGKNYFLNNYQWIDDKSMLDFFPYYTDSNGVEVKWSWDRDYNNKYAWYDKTNDLWWSPLKYALDDPDEKKTVVKLNDYVIGMDCGNITDPSDSIYPRIWGYKFEDKNADHTYDSGEPGLSGWTIKLLDAGTNEVLMTDTTDSEGYYGFDFSAYKGLLNYPKKVKLVEVNKSGWTNTLTPSDFYVYDSATTVNYYGAKYFMNFKDATIKGRKFKDVNGDGGHDTGEDYLKGWTIKLTKPNGGVVTDTTDDNGWYQFNGLEPGTYTVEEVEKSGWTRTKPSSSSGKYTIKVNQSGKTYSPYDFGNFDNVPIKGRKFEDVNGDGDRDSGEPYLKEWKIKLIKSDGTVLSDTTDSNGNYRFDNVGPGAHLVEEVQQSGWTKTKPTTDEYKVKVFDTAKAYSGYEFGNFKKATIKGRKYEDVNGDGNRDSGEDYLGSWKIKLTKPDGTIVYDWTNSTGVYQFSGLGPGTYTVEEVLKSGWTRTQPASGKYTIKVNESGHTYQYYDFGNFANATIKGRKYNDQNDPHDGVKQSDEPYLNGWYITLKNKDTGTVVGNYYTKYLDGKNGGYKFTGLGPGTYIVEEDLQADWVNTQPGPSPDPDKDYKYTITVDQSGKTYEGYDFGNYYPIPVIPISGYKYNDLNGDGQYEPEDGEYPLNGWTIVLKKDGQIIETKVTPTLLGKDGYYEFDVTDPGHYTLEEVPTQEQIDEGWKQTAPETGKYEIEAELGGIYPGNDFGNWKIPPSSISGIKYNDLNGDSQYDPDEGEFTLDNWHIILTNLDDGSTADRWTDENGYYEFGSLDPGVYTVEEDIQDGWWRTQPAAGMYTIIVEPGKNYDGYYFGNANIILGSVSGQKYEDINANGTHDPGEPYLDGWTIILKKDGREIQRTDTHTKVVSGDAVPVYAVSGDALPEYTDTGVVSADAIGGCYEFTDLSPGTYTVEEVLKDGWTQTEPSSGQYTIIIDENQQIYEGYDFGNFDNVPISGQKYEDKDGDGQHDEGELYLNGWTIILKDENGQEIQRMDTADGVVSGDALSGYYRFDNLKPGTYTVEEVPTQQQINEGWMRTEPTSGHHTIVVTESGATYSGYDFGNFKKASIEGIKYEDIDGNGGYNETEPLLSGWHIILTNLDKPDELPADQWTGTDGSYRFDNLGPGTYTVEEVLQDGWLKTEPRSVYYTIVVDESGKVYDGYYFGNFEKVSISGRKYEDMNGNGRHDEGEPYLKDWRIKLIMPGQVVTSVLTDDNGNYSFDDLGPGTYTLEETIQDKWVNTEPESGSYEIIVESGKNYDGYDFGNFKKVKIQGRKFEDINANGEYDLNEPYLNGWKIILKKDGDANFRREVITYTKTINGEAQDGYYGFYCLGPGTYTVEEELITEPDNVWIQSKPVNPNYYTFTVVSGQDSTGNDFGNYIGGKISGYKWEDKNENGVWDEGEPPLKCWKIILSKQGSTTKQYAYTDENGYYQFSALTAGRYFITEQLKTYWEQTYPSGEMDFYRVDVISRTDSKNNNFGNFKYGRKSGYKWDDINADGKWNTPTEGPLGNWSIVLMKEDTATHTYKTVSIQQTNTVGKYEFKTIHYGNYLVKEVQKDGWMQTHPAYEDENGNLIPTNYEFFAESGFLEENNNFGNWNYGSFGKTKGYWQTWEKAKRYTYDQMQAFVDFVNANSTVYGEEPFGFGNLAVSEVVDRLMTNNNEDHLKGTEQALALLEAQFLTTWLNISVQFQSPEIVVHLDKVKGAEELYEAKELPLTDVIRITEENIAKYKEFGEGEIGDGFWGRNEFITAQKIFTLINEAEDNDGYIFRPALAN